MMMLNTYWGDNLLHNLKQIAWELDTNNSVEYSYDISKTMESAIDLVEDFSGNVDAGGILDWLNTTLDEDDLLKIENTLKEWRLHDTTLGRDSNKITVDDLSEQIIKWYGFTLKQLVVQADFEGLKTSGTKEDLVRRLKEKYLEEHEVVL